LRQHLFDMDEVTMRATAQKEPIENGLRIKYPMTLMAMGMYQEPAGAFLPSILY